MILVYKTHQNCTVMDSKSVKNSKLFVLRKYVWAKSASDALKVEPKIPVDDDWKKNQKSLPDALGFRNDGDE